jgi:hypothetical protein
MWGRWADHSMTMPRASVLEEGLSGAAELSWRRAGFWTG